MKAEIFIALIAALPPTLAAVLAFISSRSVKRSVGATNGIPLSRSVEALDSKVERLSESLHQLAERQARHEERLLWHIAEGAH